MTFWVGVGVCYVVLMTLGLTFGRYLATRFPRRGDGGQFEPRPQPSPAGPSHALAWPPLGSEFDRALVPGAFADEPATETTG